MITKLSVELILHLNSLLLFPCGLTEAKKDGARRYILVLVGYSSDENKEAYRKTVLYNPKKN